MEAGFVFKFFFEVGEKALINFEGLDGVTGGEEGAGEGAEARTDFLDRFCGRRRKGGGDGNGERRFGQKILAELAEGSQAASEENFANLGRVQSWRWRMAWSSPGLRMP